MISVARLSACALALLLFWSGLSAPVQCAPADLFPEYETIQGNVSFWLRVFSEWSLGQAVVHDLDHPLLIYEIVDLPGPIKGSYTREQEEFLEQVRDGWSDYVEYLEEKVAAGGALDELEKQWILHVTDAAGTDGLVGAHERLRTQRGLRERFREGLERSTRYDEAFRAIFREEGLPEELTFLPHVESSFQWHARSSAGATGLWQFTRGTGRRYMKINSVIDERLDPMAATKGAASYLRDAYEALGSWPLALTAYNHGVHGMLRAQQKHGDYPEIFREYKGRLFGFASKNFYSEFLAAMEIASNVEQYFPEGFDSQAPFQDDSIVLERRATPRAVAETYQVKLEELQKLNLAWSSRALKRGLALPAETVVWLPAGTLSHLSRDGGSIPVPPEATVADLEGWYVVRRGDTLSQIADAHGMSLSELREVNELSRRASLIRPGQRLVVLADGRPTVHVVQRGDTLSEIAQRYRVRLNDLRSVNGLSSRSSVIRVGQRLRLPSGASGHEHVVRGGDHADRDRDALRGQADGPAQPQHLAHRLRDPPRPDAAHPVGNPGGCYSRAVSTALNRDAHRRPSDRPAPKVHPERSGPVRAEIVSIGRDLLSGRVADTNALALARFLTQRGAQVRRITTVGDDEQTISETLRAALERQPHLVITTGGLGPAREDCVVDAVSVALSLPLAVDHDAKTQVEDAYQRLKRNRAVHSTALTAAREKMCRIPIGSTPLANPLGIAPGVLCRLPGGAMLLCLPGRPEEMEAVLEGVAGQLKLGESVVAQREIESPTADEAKLRPLLDLLADEFPDVWVSSQPSAKRGLPATIRLEAVGEDHPQAESAVEIALKRLLALATGSP